MQIGVFKGPNGFEYFAPANTHNNNIEGQAILYQNKFLTLNGKKYYFGSDSKAVTGLRTIDGKNITLILTLLLQLLDGKLLMVKNTTLILTLL